MYIWFVTIYQFQMHILQKKDSITPHSESHFESLTVKNDNCFHWFTSGMNLWYWIRDNILGTKKKEQKSYHISRPSRLIEDIWTTDKNLLNMIIARSCDNTISVILGTWFLFILNFYHTWLEVCLSGVELILNTRLNFNNSNTNTITIVFFLPQPNYVIFYAFL